MRKKYIFSIQFFFQKFQYSSAFVSVYLYNCYSEVNVGVIALMLVFIVARYHLPILIDPVKKRRKLRVDSRKKRLSATMPPRNNSHQSRASFLDLYYGTTRVSLTRIFAALQRSRAHHVFVVICWFAINFDGKRVCVKGHQMPKGGREAWQKKTWFILENKKPFQKDERAKMLQIALLWIKPPARVQWYLLLVTYPWVCGKSGHSEEGHRRNEVISPYSRNPHLLEIWAAMGILQTFLLLSNDFWLVNGCKANYELQNRTNRFWDTFSYFAKKYRRTYIKRCPLFLTSKAQMKL